MKTFNSHDDEPTECDLCFDCKWVLDDASHMPFSALDLDTLLEGDEIVRCSACNSVPTPKYGTWDFHLEETKIKPKSQYIQKD